MRSENGTTDIRSLSVTAAAKVLKLSAKAIRAHISRDLPTKNGRIELVAYGAWLNTELQGRKDAADAGA